MLDRRRIILGAAALGLVPVAASAHHGWRWTDSGDFELTGTIREVRLGMPHGIVTVEAAGEAWRVEVGQPWRNHAAGLADDLLRPGVEMTALGQRSANPDERLMKAEVIILGGMRYTLYPDRV